MPKYIGYEAPSVNLDKTNAKFTLALYKDSNIIAFKTQVHFSLSNAIYFEYRATITSRKCGFDFFHSCIDKTRVTELGFIIISGNYQWINL